MIQSHWCARLPGLILSWGMLITIICLAPAPAAAQTSTTLQNPDPSQATHNHRIFSGMPVDNPETRADAMQVLSAKQRLSIMQANFAKSKTDSAEMAALAKEICEELNKPNANALALDVISRAERIEKLAKKIRDETRGF